MADENVQTADDGDGDGDTFDVSTVSDNSGAPAPAAAAVEPAAPVASATETPPVGGAAPASPAVSVADPAAPPAGAPAPATAAAPTAPAAPPAPTMPAAPEPPTLPPAGPTVQPPEVTSGQTLEQAIAARTEWRNKTIDALAIGHYNLSPELVEEMQASPELTVPKLMARVYLDATEAATMGVIRHLPQMIAGTLQRIQEAESAERDFYAAWPTLDRTKHHDAVMQLAGAYRQLNPNASKEDFIKFVGSQAIVALGLTAPAASAAPPAAVAPPFRPIASSAPAVAPHTAPQVSPFAQFAEEDILYDKGE